MFLGSLGETNAEHSEEIAVSGLGLNERLDGSVPFLDDGAELVSGNVHTVEVSVAVETFNFFNLDLHLSPGLFVAISVKISERDLKDTALQTVRSDLYKPGLTRKGLTLTSSSVARSDGGGSNVEHGGNMYIVPFLLCE